MPINIAPKDGQDTQPATKPEGDKTMDMDGDKDERKRGGACAEERKKGGGVEDKNPNPKAYNAKGSDVEEEAEKDSTEIRKAGGALKKKKKKDEKIEGHEGRPRLDRPGRKRGGAMVGANRTPLSTAANITSAEGRKGVDGDLEHD